jgi:hypothetical protein
MVGRFPQRGGALALAAEGCAGPQRWGALALRARFGVLPLSAGVRWPSARDSESFRSSGTIAGIRGFSRLGLREGAADLGAGQPCRDLAQALRLDEVDDQPTVGVTTPCSDQARPLEQSELAGRGRPAQADLLGQLRWPAVPEREQSDDPSPRRVSKQIDPSAVPLWHHEPYRPTKGFTGHHPRCGRWFRMRGSNRNWPSGRQELALRAARTGPPGGKNWPSGRQSLA